MPCLGGGVPPRQPVLNEVAELDAVLDAQRPGGASAGHEVVYERRGPGRWTSCYFNPLLYVATTNTGSTDFLVFTTTTSGFSLPTGACAR